MNTRTKKYLAIVGICFASASSLLSLPKNKVKFLVNTENAIAVEFLTGEKPLEKSTYGALFSLPENDFEYINQALHSHNNNFICSPTQLVNSFFLSTQNREVTTYDPIFSPVVKLDHIENLLTSIRGDNIVSEIKSLEALGTRHVKASNASAVTQSIHQKMATLLASKNPSLTDFSHEDIYNTEQKSVIAGLSGINDDNSIVVVSAHFDSINSKDGDSSQAPGADDNASGVATLYELMRVINDNNLSFQRRVEFHAYAAEEVGLVGSQHIASTYISQNKKVAAVLHFDMTSYRKDPEDSKIYLVVNDTSSKLRHTFKTLASTYSLATILEGVVKGGTSDHRSWFLNGFPSVFPFENTASYNPNIHSLNDTSAHLASSELLAKYAKLALVFVSHYAGLVNAESEYATKVADPAVQSSMNAAKNPEIPLSLLTKDGRFFVNAALPQSVSSVQICIKNDLNVDGENCSELLDMELRRSKSDMNIFEASTANTPKAGSRLYIHAKKSDDTIYARRQIYIK